jgi:L-aminopeptidase/D-esterase-like protein
VAPGPTNSLVDVAGLRVGHAALRGEGAQSGTTVVLAPPDGAVAGVDVRGGGPGTRETDALHPSTLVDRAHAVVLSGGSAYGLAAASGVMDALGAAGRGFRIGGPDEVVPIVPGAVVFDLGRGGRWTARPGPEQGEAALRDALEAPEGRAVPLGVVGAGRGTLVGGLKGGIGSASTVLADGTVVAAVVVANAAGSAVDPATGALWGAPFCEPSDGVPAPPAHPADAAARLADLAAPPTMNTTIGVVGTDADLDVPRTTKLAAVAHDGLARAVRPAHGMTDGDTFFALATGARPVTDLGGLQAILAAGADCVTRAVVRAVLAAEPVTTPAGRFASYLSALRAM